MTYKELAYLIGKSEGTILRNWKRTKENMEKKGIIIDKQGIGKTASYSIHFMKREL